MYRFVPDHRPPLSRYPPRGAPSAWSAAMPSHGLQELISYSVSFGTFYLLVFIARTFCVHRQGLIGRLARACGGYPNPHTYSRVPSKQPRSADEAPSAPPRLLHQATALAVSALGIQIAYVSWGIMQARNTTRMMRKCMHRSCFSCVNTLVCRGALRVHTLACSGAVMRCI